jgi:bifunctional non-homologous end joining protein LigD
VNVSNADKVLWPATGFTKGAMLDYYARVAPALLPHLRGHPLTMRRFPDGVAAPGWFQYECRGAPAWLRTAEIPYRDGTPRRFCVVDDVESLLWIANLGTIELHPLPARVETPDRPSWLVLDLDPGPPADTVTCARVALIVRAALADHGLSPVVKTSGSLGLHVYVPLHGTATFAAAKALARRIASGLARRHADAIVDRNARELRVGKVLIDWLQNDPSRSTIAPYSLRALPWPTVSTPVTWEEVERAAASGDTAALIFTVADIATRLETHGDLFRLAGERPNDLPDA